jgi:hypothetical protein
VDFPRLTLAEWRETRDALHAYSKVLGSIRRLLTPPQKHWWHISLHVSARGLTTTPILADRKTFELTLSPMHGRVELVTSEGEELNVPLIGQSQRALTDTLTRALGEIGVQYTAPSPPDEADFQYVAEAAQRYWRALSQIDAIFKEFKGGLREETGPVQIFPHHFDVSLNWFSGRLVRGADPADEENADEQMNFGFVTGDSSIPEAYFYATAYPIPERLTEAELPAGAYWNSDGFIGAILMYETLADAQDPAGRLLEFLRTTQRAGSSLMREE